MGKSEGLCQKKKMEPIWFGKYKFPHSFMHILMKMLVVVVLVTAGRV